jgi:hypothetical protein
LFRRRRQHGAASALQGKKGPMKPRGYQPLSTARKQRLQQNTEDEQWLDTSSVDVGSAVWIA